MLRGRGARDVGPGRSGGVFGPVRGGLRRVGGVRELAGVRGGVSNAKRMIANISER